MYGVGENRYENIQKKVVLFSVLVFLLEDESNICVTLLAFLKPILSL
jgi:hypothetical protein